MKKFLLPQDTPSSISKYFSIDSLYRLFTAWIFVSLLSMIQNKTVFTSFDFYNQIPLLFYILLLLFFWIIFCAIKNNLIVTLLTIGLTIVYCLFAVIEEPSIYFAFGCTVLTTIVIVFSKLTDTKLHSFGHFTWFSAAILITVYTVWIGGICCLVYLQHWTPSYDFAIFAQMFYYMKETGLPYTTCERDMLLSHFSVHISPIFYLILPFYYLFPSPLTLQIFQCLIVASGVIPLILICRNHKLSDVAAILFSICFISCSAYIGGCFYYIHENNFLVPLILWLIYFLEKGNRILSFVFTVLLLCVKEDAAIYVCVIALFFLIRKEKPSTENRFSLKELFFKTELWILIISILYFIIAVSWLSTHGNGAMTGRYDNYIYDGSHSLLTMIFAIIQNPIYVISQCFTQEKLLQILLVFVPFCFLPLFTTKWSRLILLLPFVLMNLMSSYSYQSQIGFQYHFGSCTLLFYLAIRNYADLPAIRKKLLISAVGCSMILTLSQHQNMLLRYYPDYVAHSDERNIVCETLAAIPEDASVSSSAFLVADLSQRKEVYDLFYTDKKTDFVVIDLRGGGDYDSYTNYLNDSEYELISYTENVIAVFRSISAQYNS